ncbi:MAG: ATP-dependent DNA ligase [Myxococcales bacterium]|nr:ATP-dependent DNA ligase [Myxococcales bacterium]
MPPIPPMLAETSREVPRGDYLYEPGWDGFRALIFRDGAEIVLMSQNQRPLERWFPELVRALRSRLPRKVVLDGEIVVTGPHGLDFDALLLRIHPNDSRVDKLARLHPASFVAFDLLALGAQDLRDQPMVRRRTALEKALKKATPPLYVTPATTDPKLAKEWLDRFEGGGLEGVICKPLSSPYVPGRKSMIKVRHERTADCVVAGFRRGKEGRAIASLLLGLYDHAGDLQHVGVATGLDAETRADLEARLEPLRVPDGRAHPWLGPLTRPDLRVPGGSQSWADDRHAAWEAVEPSLVARVEYDHMQGERFRHATHFQRLVADRDPRSCTFEQVSRRSSAELVSLLRAS